MKERNWKYKITGNWFGPMVIAITTAVSGGFTFWLYTAHDGAFVGLGGLTAFFAIICVLSAYGAMSFKLLVDTGKSRTQSAIRWGSTPFLP